MRFEALDAKDWVAASLEGLETHPRRDASWCMARMIDLSVLANDIGIEIEASLAFGTGHHGTTRGCLLALDSILRQGRPARVLDVGTGTGVLAIAAAKVLRSGIVAGDIDPVAIEVARRTRARTASPHAFASIARPVFATRSPPDPGASISSSPTSWQGRSRVFRPLSPARLSPKGRLVVSGLLEARRRHGAFGLSPPRASSRATIPHRRLGHLDPELTPGRRAGEFSAARRQIIERPHADLRS